MIIVLGSERPPKTPVIHGFNVDIDGTLLDTEKFQFMAWQRTIQEQFGFQFQKEEYKPLAGNGRPYVAGKLIEQYGLNISVTDFVTEKLRTLDHILRTEPIAYRDGAEDALQFMEGFPKALVTGGTAEEVYLKFDRLGVLEQFKDVPLISSDRYEHAKPHPECHLLGVETLGIPARHVMSFEDTEAGAISAHDAGTHSVAIKDKRFTDKNAFVGAKQTYASWDAALRQLPKHYAFKKVV